jgi:glycosyltransferase involved in cell wall biosynthesis
MNLPKISVVIPTLNVEDSLSGALDSIVSQTYKNVEVVIVDSLSSDNTLKIIKDYSKRYNYIKFISEKDNGLYDAMNKGIDISTGDWLYFMGADDRLYDKDVFKDVYKTKLFSGDKVVYGNVYVIGDNPWAKDKTIYDGEFNLEKLLQKNICHQAVFYPGKIIEDIGYFNPEYPITADYDYNLRCYAKHEFVYIDRIIAKFYSGGASSQSGMEIRFTEFAENIFKYFGVDPHNNKYSVKNSPFVHIVNNYRYLNLSLNPYKDEITDGISLISVLDKNYISTDVLLSWAEHKDINEIILVTPAEFDYITEPDNKELKEKLM